MTDKEEMKSKMQKDAQEKGYHLCPDPELLDDLLEGLVENVEKYGYGSCPCRPASGVKAYDVDIICPCEYRDADADEFGMCYCGLFVSDEVRDDPSRLGSIPERRPSEVIDAAMEAKEKKERGELEEDGEAVDQVSPSAAAGGEGDGGAIPVWRCEVCGYLAAREMPPPVCPICKAKRDRFERFSFG